MSKNKTTIEINEIVTTLYDLCDDDFFEVCALYAEKHDMDIRKFGTNGIFIFTNWLSDVLFEIRNMK